jgi:hypothetical protein
LLVRILEDAEDAFSFDPLTVSIPIGRDGGGGRVVVDILI